MKTLIPGFLILFFLATDDLLGQVKYEKESRVQAEEVPLRARQFVDSLGFARRVRWYSEISERGKSVEAKSKRNGQRVSVEFGLAGELQDVEVELAWKQLPESLREDIRQDLNTEFQRFKIRKVQRQLTGKRAEIVEYLNHQSDDDGLIIRYEIVLKGRKNGRTHEFEYTYSAEGQLKKKAKMVFRNTDNLEY